MKLIALFIIKIIFRNHFFKRLLIRGGEMAQSVKCLSPKFVSPELTYKKPNMMARPYNPALRR